jgi:hypothetical protein
MLELTLSGICLTYGFRALVLTGPGAEEAARRAKWTIATHSEVPLHLGVALFDRPFVFTPTHIITERQQTIEGPAVFDWLVEGCYRMPRSEVFGFDVHGSAVQVFAREIDIEESPIAVYGHGTWVVAVVEIDPASERQTQILNRMQLPHRFGVALKHYRCGLDKNLKDLL